ncbi:MAG TPA: DUF2167 domain-containing protein [Planctomycetota bacterium]|jgi:uncharacterized membrane-anchored protein|nr:DUF2167 domain-containing protein [Planctomycetota bacterium]
MLFDSLSGRHFLVAVAIILSSVALSTQPVFSQGEEETEESHQDVMEGQNPFQELLNSLNWTKGPNRVPIELIATLDLPEGLRSIASADTQKLQKFVGNNTSEAELLTVAPEVWGDWLILFSWDDCGYVKDEDRDELDGDTLLKSMRENQEADNKRRKAAGLPTLTIDSWAVPPRYNEKSNHLEWATRLKTDSGEAVINYQTRVLGRNGVMSVILVCPTEELGALSQRTNELLKSFSYSSGEKYAEYKKGDKVAQYTLAGLVTGGGIAVLAKAGLLQKFWKVLIIPILAAGAFLKRIFGGKAKSK